MSTKTFAIPSTSKGFGTLNFVIGNIGLDYLGMVMNSVTGVDSTHPLKRAKDKVMSKARTDKLRTPDQRRDIRLAELVLSGYWKHQSFQEPTEGKNTNLEGNPITLLFDGWDTPYVPGGNLRAMIKSAAKIGKQGKTIEKGIICHDAVLDYEGPKSANELIVLPQHDLRMTTCNGGKSSKVMKSRLMFPEWKLNFKVTVDENVIDPAEVVDYVFQAGRVLGLNDARSLGYGRFDILEEPTYTA